MSRYYHKVNEAETTGRHFITRLFKNALEYGWSSREIQDKYNGYRADINLQQLPRYVSSYLTGCFDTLSTKIHNEDLEFCYIVKGKRYSIRKESDMNYEKCGITPEALSSSYTESGYYWIKTGKKYFSRKTTR